MTSLKITGVEVLEDEREKRDLPDTATITRPRPLVEIRESIRGVVERASGHAFDAEEMAYDLITAIEVQRRLEGDTGERISFEEFAVSEGFDLGQLRS